MEKLAIVAVGYNRKECYKRLIGSLVNADYGDDSVDLICSIDKAENAIVSEYAKEIEWRYGKKRIIEYPERLGLKRHMYMLGNLLNEYDAIIVLEDDIYVSPRFYDYVKQTVLFYQREKTVLGISLYNFAYEMETLRPFYPLNSGMDCYFLQRAMSWGQVWIRDSWKEFMRWYAENGEKEADVSSLCDSVQKFPETSFLRCVELYMQLHNKFFVYPYYSRSTCFAAAGQHFQQGTNAYQVPILADGLKNRKLLLTSLGNADVVYDSYFENMQLGKVLNIDKNDLCVDLYGNKRNREKKRFWLTSRIESYKIIKKYGLQLKPIELNIIEEIDGNELFLYDTFEKTENLCKIQKNTHHVYDYGSRIEQMYFIKEVLAEKIRSKLFRK